MTVTAVIENSAAAARKAMIDSQLRVSGINQDWLLAAIGRVPREDYVPAEARGHAYIDRAIPLGEGHALPAPLAQAMLLATAAPTGHDRVLLVSCGSDYLAALVKPLVADLVVMSAAEAAGLTRGLGDRTLVLVDGAIGHLPAGLAKQLADGGRIVAGLIDKGVSRLASGIKRGEEVEMTALAEVGIPALPEFAAPKSWSF